MASAKLLDPASNDTRPVFLRNVYDDVDQLSEEETRQRRVLKIRLFREDTFVGHEFLILDVFDRKDLVRLLVERRPSCRKADKRSPRWNPFKWDLLVSDGDDIVKRVSDDFSPAPYHLLTTLSADVVEEGPPFADVIRILWEVLRPAPNYTLFRRQCYWFTGNAVEVLKSQYGEQGGEFVLHAKNGPMAKLRGTTGCVKIYPEDKAKQHLAHQAREEEEKQEKREKKLREDMRQAVNNAVTMAREEESKAKEAMQRAVQPLLTTPEAYQRAFWEKAMASVEEESQKTKEELRRAVQSLMIQPSTPQYGDAQYWQSVLRNVTESRV